MGTGGRRRGRDGGRRKEGGKEVSWERGKRRGGGGEGVLAAVPCARCVLTGRQAGRQMCCHAVARRQGERPEEEEQEEEAASKCWLHCTQQEGTYTYLVLGGGRATN